MPKIRYVGPIVGVDIIIAGLSDVKPGDEFDVTAEVAEQLLHDDTMFLPADKAAKSVVVALAAAEQAKADAAAAAEQEAALAAEIERADAEAAAAFAAAEAEAAAAFAASQDTDPAQEG